MSFGTLYDTVVSNLKGVIGSNKDGISLNSIASEYEFFVGHSFPISQLGYDSIISFLKSVPHLFKIKYSGYGTRVYNLIDKNESESNLILYDMIQNTTAKKGPKFRRMPFLSNHKSFGNNHGTNSSFSYSNYCKSSTNGGANGFATTGFNSFSANNLPSFENFKIQVENNTNNNNKQLKTKNDFYLSESEKSSDSGSNESVSSIGIQTEEIEYKKILTTLSTLKTSKFVDILIEIIIEFKPLNLDNVVFFKIRTDLYYYFCLFTGMNVSPAVFTNIVRNALLTLKTDELYADLIYGDDTGKYCCLNLFNTNFTLFHLPHLEFNANTNYCAEVLAVTPDAICAVKFSDDSVLRWSKSRPLSEEAKLLIETQQFWSWIPGSLCLVQLPHHLVELHKLLRVERAIIVSTEFATPNEVRKSKTNHIILHKTSFYLIDHKRYVLNILSSSSSFQVIKRTAYKDNETNIANVCNVSIRARCMPSKIQFVKIQNFNDVAQILRNGSGAFMSSQTLILYRCQKSEMMINFQPIFSCYSIINKKKFELNRVIENYYDDVVKTPGRSIEKRISKNKMRSDDIEVIVISDSDEDDANNHQVIDLTTSNSRGTKHSSSSYEDEAIIAKCIIQPIGNAEVTKSNQSNDNLVKQDEEDRISVISFTDDELAEKVSSVSSISNENGDQSEHLDSCVEEHVGQLDAQSRQKLGKCIIPITSDLCSHFNERVVRILHLQSGAAVVTLLESTGLMKRELKMLSVMNQELSPVVDDISIGDYFIWCNNEEIDYIKAINNKTMALVEILQVINDEMALVSLVHHGLIINVKRDDLRLIPKHSNGIDDLTDLIGPMIGAFDLHMIPNWYCTELDQSITDQLFTAFFINENELVLQYFNDPCKFYNLQLLSAIEMSLTNNHCNARSKSFITMLSDSLMSCRLFVGNLLVLSTAITEELSIHSSLPVSNTLVRITKDDEPGVWFASIDVVNECGELIEKLSPHCFAEEKFSVDRVEIDKTKDKLRLLDHQNIYVEIPEYFQGIYKFEKKLLNEFMKSNAEFLCRYMLIGATEIPDLNFLFNKLIF